MPRFLFLCFLLLSVVCLGQAQPTTVGRAGPLQLEQALAGTGFAGVVLVGRGDSIVWQRGYDYADREQRIRNGIGTAFDLGSLTKQFTATAILALEQAGKLRVEDSLGRFFSTAPADKRGITLHQLLTHTAGLRGALGQDEQWLSKEAFVRRALRSKLTQAPGAGYRYSNVGYSLLAVIIEAVAGIPYEQYLQERLFQPAGLTHTGSRLVAWPDSLLAVGYAQGKRQGKPNVKGWHPDGPSWTLRGNGGILSTAPDMWRWHLALESGRILTPAEHDKLYRPYVAKAAAGPIYYGYGWSVYQSERDTRVVSHTGSNNVFFANFVRYLDVRDGPTVLYVATNQSEETAIKVSQAVMRLLFPPHKSQ